MTNSMKFYKISDYIVMIILSLSRPLISFYFLYCLSSALAIRPTHRFVDPLVFRTETRRLIHRQPKSLNPQTTKSSAASTNSWISLPI